MTRVTKGDTFSYPGVTCALCANNLFAINRLNQAAECLRCGGQFSAADGSLLPLSVLEVVTRMEDGRCTLTQAGRRIAIEAAQQLRDKDEDEAGHVAIG